MGTMVGLCGLGLEFGGQLFDFALEGRVFGPLADNPVVVFFVHLRGWFRHATALPCHAGMGWGWSGGRVVQHLNPEKYVKGLS
jgi:hypothetical protein